MSKKYEVSFIDKETYRWLLKEAPKDGLCLKRFRADLTVEGLLMRKKGDVIEIGGNRYELLKMGKRCFEECELLRREGKKCPLADGVAFGRKL